MVSISRNNLNQKTIMPSIKPEVVEFFQNEINPNMTPDRIAEVVESLKPGFKSNPIIGSPVNLLYLQNDNNLAAVVIQEDGTNNLYTFSTEPNLNARPNTIAINNLKDFQFRLQDALNYDLLISIYYTNNKIESLVIVKREQSSQLIPGDPQISSIGKKSRCELPPNFC